MYYLIYKTTNTENGKFYIGAHRTDDKEDSYLGSGIALKHAIEKYGKESFRREILKECDSGEEMYEEERRIVDKFLADPMCYNMRSGGKGGWDHVDNSGDRNSMRDPEIAKRCGESISATKRNDPKYAEIARANGQKAAEKHRGTKKPQHSAFMKEKAKEVWERPGVKEKFRDSRNDWFLIITPDGDTIETNRLTQVCEELNLPFTTVWKNSQTEGAITKGRAKGYTCQTILK